MLIGGFQKMTVLDYPGKVACTVFLTGCNFRCPFCHNASLVTERWSQGVSTGDIFAYLQKRKGLLDGVCITGGEPLLNDDIDELIRPIKELGYLVKLDTNGSNPEKLRELMENGLVDYVAMDIKNSAEKYALTCGVKAVNFTKIKESIDLLINGNVDYEFRTTVVSQLHSVEDIENVGKLVKGAKALYLQGFVDSGELIGSGMSAADKQTMEKMLEAVRPYVQRTELRGV
ncbi:MAG: anaerobic ribonucleoside-triphosphate reductase activating protein [Acutalibacteraceae bacterium]|nr:anaerobic ribonucleoside-triphosphate reductase activating protein [Oscillospiraceae bacterium]